MTTEHPLGDIDGTDASATSPALDHVSIVDTILNLDELLSGDIRRAEKVIRICTRPDLEGDIDELEAELAGLVDVNGNPIDTEEALGGGRSAGTVAMEIRELQRQMAASMRSIRVRQMPEKEWAVFRETHLKGDDDISDDVWDLMIAASAIAPAMTVEQVQGLRAAVGHPQVDKIATGVWNVNTKSGVSIPKSLTSSVVLKRMQR